MVSASEAHLRHIIITSRLFKVLSQSHQHLIFFFSCRGQLIDALTFLAFWINANSCFFPAVFPRSLHPICEGFSSGFRTVRI